MAFFEKSEAKFLEKIKISYNTEFIAVVKENDDLYKLNEIYYLLKKVSIVTNYGTWDLKNGLSVNRPDLSFYDRRLNMNKVVLYVVDVSSPISQI